MGALAAPGDAAVRRVGGDGWTLTLGAGWSVRPDPTRPGSYVVRADAPS